MKHQQPQQHQHQLHKSSRTSISRFISDYLPTTIGATLTVFLLWSFIVAPYISESELDGSLEKPTLDAQQIPQSARHPLAYKSASKQSSTSTSSSYNHKTEYMPERTDLASLLNKSLSIDPLLNNTFALGPRVSDWDSQRSSWFEAHPDAPRDKVFLITGSQPTPCLNLLGDYHLLRSTKNKMDYGRMHGIEVFYNLATFTADMPSWWVKLPLIRSFMLTRPDVEWFWWMDSDAVFTDMSFTMPLERYRDHNLVIHGWDHLVYGERKWTGLNMGIFMVRNSQWTLDLFDTLAPMGLRGTVGDRVGKILTMALTGRPEDFESDDQGAFIYLVNAERERFGSKVYLENSYYLNGYWKDIVDRFEEFLRNGRESGEGWPFVTHFTGCQICSGKINSVYSREECTRDMERALVFADDQVLQLIGYVHPSLSTHEIVRRGVSASHEN